MVARYDSSIQFDSDLFDQFFNTATTTYSDSELCIRDGVSIKLKPFYYGRRISDFKPNKSPVLFGINILAILADGSVVPCCLACDNSLSLANLHDNTLENILKDSSGWFHDLRYFSVLRSPTFQSCLGEPANRGLILKTLRTYFSELKNRMLSR
jgi:hypothetical protein